MKRYTIYNKLFIVFCVAMIALMRIVVAIARLQKLNGKTRGFAVLRAGLATDECPAVDPVLYHRSRARANAATCAKLRCTAAIVASRDFA